MKSICNSLYKSILVFIIVMLLSNVLFAQTSPKSGIFNVKINMAFTIDSILQTAEAYSCFLFPDTTILIDNQGIISRPQVHGIAEVMDYNSPWIFPPNYLVHFEHFGYFLDSVRIYGFYRRNSDSTIIDTLIVQIAQVKPIDYSLNSSNFPSLMSNYGVNQIPYYPVYHDYNSTLSNDSSSLTLKIPLSNSDTGIYSVPQSIYSAGHFTIGEHCGTYIQAGKRVQVIVSFKPGYSWIPNQDTLNKLNYFKFISQEENGANTIQNYSSNDFFMSYILNSQGLYSLTDNQYTPSYKFEVGSYKYERHWIDFYLSYGHMDQLWPDTIYINYFDTLTNSGITDDYFQYTISDTSWLKIENINGKYYYKTNPNFSGERMALVVFSNCSYSQYIIVLQKSTGIENPDQGFISIEVQPNPFSDFTTLEINLTENAMADLKNLRI